MQQHVALRRRRFAWVTLSVAAGLSFAPAVALACSATMAQNGASMISTSVTNYGNTLASYMQMFGIMGSSSSSASQSVQQALQTQNSTNTYLNDVQVSSYFNQEKAVAEAAVSVNFAGANRAVCMLTRQDDLTERAHQNFLTQQRARSQAGTRRITGNSPATANGSIATVAYTYQNDFLTNADCNPGMALPAGQTCTPMPGMPADYGLQPEAIFHEDNDDPAEPWRKRGAELYVNRMTPTPIAVPKGNLLATPAGRAQFVAYQSWAAKAGLVNWAFSTSAAMGDSVDISSPDENYGRYSYRKALSEMVKGKFDASNPLVGKEIALVMAQDTEKNNIEAVGFKLSNVQGRLLWEIMKRIEHIGLVDAALLGDQLEQSKGGGYINTGLQK